MMHPGIKVTSAPGPSARTRAPAPRRRPRLEPRVATRTRRRASAGTRSLGAGSGPQLVTSRRALGHDPAKEPAPLAPPRPCSAGP